MEEMGNTSNTTHDTAYDEIIQKLKESYSKGFDDGMYTAICILLQVIDVKTFNLLIATIRSTDIDYDKVHKLRKELQTAMRTCKR